MAKERGRWGRRERERDMVKVGDGEWRERDGKGESEIGKRGGNGEQREGGSQETQLMNEKKEETRGEVVNLWQC